MRARRPAQPPRPPRHPCAGPRSPTAPAGREPPARRRSAAAHRPDGVATATRPQLLQIRSKSAQNRRGRRIAAPRRAEPRPSPHDLPEGTRGERRQRRACARRCGGPTAAAERALGAQEGSEQGGCGGGECARGERGGGRDAPEPPPQMPCRRGPRVARGVEVRRVDAGPLLVRRVFAARRVTCESGSRAVRGSGTG